MILICPEQIPNRLKLILRQPRLILSQPRAILNWLEEILNYRSQFPISTGKLRIGLMQLGIVPRETLNKGVFV